jgi:hypothetical protein
MQTSYVQPACGCSTGIASTMAAPQQNVVSAPPAQPTPAEPKPTLESTQPQAQPSSPASTTAQHPIEPATPPAPAPQTQPAQPAAAHPEYDVKKNENSTYLESPKLFNPQDRTAKHSIAPVHTALYEQPAKYSKISTTQTVLDAEQVKKDAAGWSNKIFRLKLGR